jgi:hypothetical protein
MQMKFQRRTKQQKGRNNIFVKFLKMFIDDDDDDDDDDYDDYDDGGGGDDDDDDDDDKTCVEKLKLKFIKT